MIKFFQSFKGYIISIVGTMLLIVLILIFRAYLNPATVSLMLLPAVLFSATFFGSRPALFSSVIGILGFNFFFLPPYYTFTISEPQNLLAFGVFLLIAVTAGQLSAYAKKRAEESEQRRGEIERLYDELQAAFKQASEAEAFKQSEKLKSSLLDAVTHDIRTPLTSIKASVTALLEDREEELLDEEGRGEFLEIINEETDRLNEFIEGMVGLAKIEANALQIRKKWFDVEEVVNNAVERARKLLENHKIFFEREEILPQIFIDGAAISEVIYTLLDNAAKYSPKNTPIKISSRQISGDLIEISVEDEGGGIPANLREKVFSKFYRREKSDAHTSSSGLGLGLAIARGIVESQNGRMWIEDGTDGYATKFVFTVKISEDKNDTQLQEKQTV